MLPGRWLRNKSSGVLWLSTVRTCTRVVRKNAYKTQFRPRAIVGPSMCTKKKKYRRRISRFTSKIENFDALFYQLFLFIYLFIHIRIYVYKHTAHTFNNIGCIPTPRAEWPEDVTDMLMAETSSHKATYYHNIYDSIYFLLFM